VGVSLCSAWSLHCFVKQLMNHCRATFDMLWSKSCVFQNKAKIMCQRGFPSTMSIILEETSVTATNCQLSRVQLQNFTKFWFVCIYRIYSFANRCVFSRGWWSRAAYIFQASLAVLQVFNCEIGFQDLEKVLNLVKMHIKYWKMYGNSKCSHLFIQILFCAAHDCFADVVCILFHE